MKPVSWDLSLPLVLLYWGSNPGAARKALATLLCLSESPESWCLVGWMGTKDGHCRVPYPLTQLHHSLVSTEGRDALIPPPSTTLSVGQTVCLVLFHFYSSRWKGLLKVLGDREARGV